MAARRVRRKKEITASPPVCFASSSEPFPDLNPAGPVAVSWAAQIVPVVCVSGTWRAASGTNRCRASKGEVPHRVRAAAELESGGRRPGGAAAALLSLAINDAALGEIVRRKLDVDFVAGH